MATTLKETRPKRPRNTNIARVLDSAREVGAVPVDNRSIAEQSQLAVLVEYQKWNDFQRKQTGRLFAVFFALNILVPTLVFVFWLGDRFGWGSPANAAPIVTTNLVGGLVGATATQLGILVVTVGPKIFRPPPDLKLSD